MHRTSCRYSHHRQPLCCPTLLWDSIKRCSIFQAGIKHLVNRQSASQALARWVHGQGQLSTPPDAHLMLFPNAIIASQQFLLIITISAQACCSDLAACMMLAVVPIHIGCSAMVIRVQELMRESMIHFLLTQQMIVAQYDLQHNVTVSNDPLARKVMVSITAAKQVRQSYPIRRSEPTTCLCRTILDPKKASFYLTASLHMGHLLTSSAQIIHQHVQYQTL